jgi:hypothetical protein
MRTTIRMDEQLLRAAKAEASAHGQTLTAFIEDAVREVLARRAEPRPRVDLPVYHGGGLRPGVDLDNSAELWDLLEEHDRPL